MASNRQQHKQQQESQLIREALAVLDFHLRCSSIKLTKQIQYLKNEQGYLIPIEYERLAVATSYNQNFSLKDSAKRDSSNLVNYGHRLGWLVVNLFLLYASARFFQLACIHLEHDRLVEKIWPPNSDLLAGFFKDCSPFKNGGSIEAKDAKQLAEFAHKIEGQIGAPLQTFVGVGPVVDSFLSGTGVLIYVAGFLAILFKRPRLDLWNFIENRHYERRRFQLELYNLVDSLFVTRRVVQGDGSHRFQYSMKCDLFGRSHEHLRSWLLDMDQFWDDFEILKARGSSHEDYSIVLSMELHHLIRPVHLSDRWHRRVCNCLRMVPVIRVLCIFPAIVLMVLIGIFEMLNRINVRLAEIKCNATMENNPRAYFNMEQLSFEERTLYQNYDGSLRELMALYSIESRLSVRTILWFNHLLALVAAAAIAILVPLYSGIYIYDYQAKMLWLTQIERQLNQCLSSLTEGIKSAHGRTDCELIGGSQRRQESLKLITLAYLNYELFRREQRNYQSLTNILTMQMFVMNFTSLVTCYYMCAALRGARNFVTLVLVTYIALFLNSYFISCAIRTSKILKLMKNICRLAAFSVDNSLRLSPIVELWSMQLLPHQETMSCFAPKLLGISVSFDKIITFNAYLVALWLFATRE